jgi:dolichol-phosphate mannosyltransferase
MKISIVVPVFNEEATIGLVLDRLSSLDVDKEVIVIDDGSTDTTATVVRGHTSDLVIEHLPQNAGKGSAVRRGIELATGDILVIQDADLELSPDVISQLAAPIEAGVADAVYGSRFLAGATGVPLTRRAANRLLTFLTNRLYGTRLSDMETAHKAIRLDLVRSFPLKSTRFEIEVELTTKLARSGARIKEVSSPYRPRTKDEGKKIRWSDGLLALRTIWRYRTWAPLSERSSHQEAEKTGSETRLVPPPRS